MARGGGNRGINPAQLHGSKTGELAFYTQKVKEPLYEWLESRYEPNPSKVDEENQKMQDVLLSMRLSKDLPSSLQEGLTLLALDNISSARERGLPRALRGPVKEFLTDIEDYRDRIAWTFSPKEQERFLKAKPIWEDQTTQQLLRTRSATSLLAALDTAPDSGVSELEALRIVGLRSAEEAWAALRRGENAAWSDFEAGWLYLAVAQDRRGKSRNKEIAPLIAQLKYAARENDLIADQVAVATVPEDSWMESLRAGKRPYIHRLGDVVMLGPDAYQDLRSDTKSDRARVHLAHALLEPELETPEDASKANLLIQGALTHLKSADILERSDLLQGDVKGPYYRAKEALSLAIEKQGFSDDKQIYAAFERQKAPRARTWQAAEETLSSWKQKK